MAFTVGDVRDLLTVLRQNPEWKAEVRREILSDELLSLPDLVRQNSADIRDLQEIVRQNSADIRQNSADIRQNSADIRQNSADIRDLQEIVRQNSADILQNSADIRDLQEIVRQNSADIRQNSADIRQNSQDIRQNSQDIKALTEVVAAMDQRMVAMDQRMVAMVEEMVSMNRRLVSLDGRLGALKGDVDEAKWTRNAEGRFGRRLNRTRVVTPRELGEFNTALDDGRISDDEAAAVRELDIILEGVEGKALERRPALLAVEVSTTIEGNDVSRAIARAEVLRRCGYNAYAAVAGSRISRQTRELAEASGVEVFVRPD